MNSAEASRALSALYSEIESFEAPPSKPDTGTGARREGSDFEALVLRWWDALADLFAATGAKGEVVAAPSGARMRVCHHAGRSLYLPTQRRAQQARDPDVPGEWLRTQFLVSELVRAFPGEEEAIARYAPAQGPYAAGNYPSMYAGRGTKFDGTLVLAEAGVLKKKILLEYKSAKRKGESLEGNVHERLTFQAMQYLEVATRYTHCSLVVVANGAFARYRNKYHVAFHAQADRLSNFAWFGMRFLCTRDEYEEFASDLMGWLVRGGPVPQVGRGG
jgi:hypothetical protein